MYCHKDKRYVGNDKKNVNTVISNKSTVYIPVQFTVSLIKSIVAAHYLFTVLLVLYFVRRSRVFMSYVITIKL